MARDLWDHGNKTDSDPYFWDGNIPAPLKLCSTQLTGPPTNFWDGNIPAALNRTEFQATTGHRNHSWTAKRFTPLHAP
jgi:hypothetical protein